MRGIDTLPKSWYDVNSLVKRYDSSEPNHTVLICVKGGRKEKHMKITTFNPLIVTAHSDDIVKLFEELGFEVRHEKKELDSVAGRDVRMRDANGNHVDVVQVDQMPRDLTEIRMNVDSFEEAVSLLTSHGFMSTRKDGTISEDSTGKGVGMVSPSGFIIAVAQHIKKEE